MRTGPLVLAVVVMLALAGCVPSPSHPTAAPSSRATPLFASDEEALAAAEAAYAAYLRVSAAITSSGGTDVSAIDPLVTGAQAAKEHDTYKYFSDRGLHTEGEPTHGPLQLESVTYSTSGAAKVAFYACVDASKVQVLDSSGVDVTPPGRADRTPLEVTMLSSTKDRSKLVVSESNTWSGTGVCP